MIRRMRATARAHEDAGSVTVETVIIFPGLLLIGALLLMAGRLAIAQSTVESAAAEAARVASISRTADTAAAQAHSTASSTLDNSQMSCATLSVAPDVSAFSLPVGQVGAVSVTVTCVVPLADLGIPGAPGSHTITKTSTSVLDAYRGRS